MLEEVKTILINQKEKELNQIEVINKQIAELNQKEKQNNFTVIDKHIIELENEIARINQSLITKLSASKKLKKLYDEYYQLSANKIKVLEEFNNEREKLIIELSKLINVPIVFDYHHHICNHNNLKIDFIGKWHLGEDLNMNYYCEK